MVAWEDHRLLSHQSMSAPAVVHLFLLLFEEHKVTEDVEEAVELKDFLPEVTRAVAGLVLGIPRAADDLAGMAAAVERQEIRLLPRQPCGHVNLFRVSGEMHQCPLLELEQRRARIAVFLVRSEERRVGKECRSRWSP